MENTMPLYQVEKFTRGKFKTLEECKEVINVNSFSDLKENQLVNVINILMSEAIVPKGQKYANILSETIVKLINDNLSLEDKAMLVTNAFKESITEYGITELNYDFYIKLISTLTYMQMR